MRISLIDDDNGRPRCGEIDAPSIEVTTNGCGCCEDHEYYHTQTAALQAILEEEDRLKSDLKALSAIRRRVRKWKS